MLYFALTMGDVSDATALAGQSSLTSATFADAATLAGLLSWLAVAMFADARSLAVFVFG